MDAERKGTDETDFVVKMSSKTTSSDGIAASGGCKLFEASTKHLTKLENMHIFNSFPYRKKVTTTTASNSGGGGGTDEDGNLILKTKPKPFVKSASIAKLFGNNYSTKKNETNQLMLHQQNTLNNNNNSKGINSLSSLNNNSSNNSSNKVKIERFYQKIKCDDILDDRNSICNSSSSINDNSNACGGNTKNNNNEQDLSLKAIRTLSRGLGKLLRRRSSSVNISEPDPEFKVVYLGNVLTGWAKGEGCVDKPLATLWRNYTQNSKPDVIMKIRVCSSGLKATTKQHGLTEYWSHRITYCAAPKNYPRIFCWVYRHEGRKLKNEMRCHAVLCTKNLIAQEIGKKLQDNIARALCEFKRDKISRQNARLSLVNSVYENPSMPRRKILLSVGGNNYRPPLERSKSAPKLMAIEEIIGEEDEFDENENGMEPNGNLNEGKVTCENGMKYSTMTLGRRRGSRGSALKRRNSLRRSKRNEFQKTNITSPAVSSTSQEPSSTQTQKEILPHSVPENEDDFTIMEPLEGEIMSYFDMKLKSNLNSTSLNDLDSIECNARKGCNGDGNKLCSRNSQSMDDLDDTDNTYDNEINPDAHVFFNQNDILDIIRKHTLTNMNTPESAVEPDYNENTCDGQSESSGCETPSLLTILNENDSLVVLESPNKRNLKYIQKFHRSITYPLDENAKNEILEQDGEIFLDPQDAIRLMESDDGQSHINYDEDKTKLFSQNIKRQHLKYDSRTRGGCLNETDLNNLRTLCIDDGNDGNVSEYSDESGYVEENNEHIERSKLNTKFSGEFVIN